MSTTDVLSVSESLLATSRSLPLGDVDAVFVDKFPVDRAGRFTIWDLAGDVPVVAVSKVASTTAQ